MFAKAAITGTLQAGGPTFTAEYLVIAGGGGGSTLHAGGGGAGGYRSSVTGESSGGGASAETALSIALGTAYAVTIGAGGASIPVGYSSVSNKGNDSVFGTITSAAGGAGVLGGIEPPGNADGGSGGGGGAGGVATSPAGSGTADQGFNGGEGGNAGGYTYHGGGGGGAAQIGGNCIVGTKAGDGGDGVQSYITGSAVYRAGGGGGSSYAHPGGAGGLGGGGAGGGNSAGTAGTANTGGGGGAGGGPNAANVSGAGGSGVVIIRVPSTVVAEFSAGVVYNYIPLDDFNVYEITAAGVSDTVTFSQGAVTTVGESLRFNDDDSAYLYRTPASVGNRKTYTFSAWVKFSAAATNQFIFSGAGGSARWGLYLSSAGKLATDLQFTGTYNESLATYRDPSAWYHLVWKVDTTAPTAIDRSVIYINGKRIADANTRTFSLNADTNINDAAAHYISNTSSPNWYFDGYMSDVYFIDGEALDPSRFGKQDADGIWQPISYTGSYGTNGFHLDFADNSTAAALGTDTSGNGNDWTPSGITTDDQVTDTPSVNYATWNPLAVGNRTFANGNLDVTMSSSAPSKIVSTFGASSGKYYMEYVHQGNANWPVGISADSRQRDYLGISDGNTSVSFWCDSGATALYINGSSQPFSGSGTAWVASDIVGVALDADNEEVLLYKNGVLVGSAVSYASYNWAQAFFAAGNYVSGNQYITNFGQRPFAYTPPTGFQALSSANLPDPVIADGKEHFQPVLYTGNGTSQTVRGLEFQPDFVWIKDRTSANNHSLHDTIRGANQYLFSSSTAAEGTQTNRLLSFNSNGFAVGSRAGVNTNSNAYVAWNWNAGGSTVTNTDGTITSQVRANTDAGFSIVSYTGNGTAGATVGHGLGAAPEMLIFKQRNSVSGRNWPVYHEEIGASNIVYLNLTNASLSSTALNNTAPSSSVITLGSVDDSNGTSQSNTYIAYCFAGVDGFSKFGSYTGNGSTDGPFIYTGFRPAFVIMKRTDSTSSWCMFDDKRNSYNEVNELLNADVADAEYVNVGGVDFLSNGFKQRNTNSNRNASGGTYIFMAFAENPFKLSRAR